MWAEPAPAPAPQTSHDDGPPEDLSPQPFRLHYRPRDLDTYGVGPWRTCWFDSEGARVIFMTTWAHDFEMDTL